jgi:BMFP domain-containing protein YqiC
MQSQNPFIDEMSKLTQAAMGLAQAAGEEAKSAFRAQSDKWASEMDLIRRDEFEALKARIDALEGRLDVLSAQPKS